MSADEVIARARALIGTRFALHGRDPAHGVDCVGLVALATLQIAIAPCGYAMRNTRVSEWEALLASAFQGLRDPLEAGSIHFYHAGPAQYHLGIWTGHSLIHADARVRRVVETPAPPAWALVSAWALKP